MKTKAIILLLSLSILFTSSCRKGSIWGIYGKGPSESQKKELNGFSSIYTDCDADIVFIQDSIYGVTVTGQQNIINVLDIRVSESQLRISYLREVRRHDGLTVTVRSPFMNGIHISGSSNVSVLNKLTTNSLSLYINGSGDISIPTLTCTQLDNKISGSGNISVNNGSCTNAIYTISGSGNISTLAMPTSSVVAKISGSGNISVHAVDKLDVNISGSGDVRYKGSPALTSKISGSGNLIHLN